MSYLTPRQLTKLYITKHYRWRKTLGNKIVFEREHHSGGHFAAYEVPEVLAQDLRDMFGKGGPAFKVVEGRPGYAKL